MNDMKSQSRPLYVFAPPQSWSRWAKDLPDWFLLPQAGLKGQTTPQLVLIEWAMAHERLAELFDEYRLPQHRVLLVVKSDREETQALASGFGNDVCREALLGEQIGARWERMNRLAQRPGGDVLTGLMDRLSAMEALNEEIQGPHGGPLWFALFDLDNFKFINDQYGHEEGDRVIVAVADQLRRRFADAPVLCRFGGNEFLLCLRMGRDEARERIEAFRASLADLRLPKGPAVTISGGLGMHRPGESVKSLIERVEKNLYHAKANGRDRLVDDGESATSAATSSLDTGMLDFENRVKVYAERLVTGLTHHGRKMAEVYQDEAEHDGLTGLFNRRYFDRRLEREMENSRKTATPLTLVLLDLDDFGAVNRQYGYPAGDRALRAAAEAILKTIRVVDWAGRYGGEELCGVFPNTDAATASFIAERIRAAIESLDLEGVDGRKFRITGSFGVVTLADDDASTAHLIQRVGLAVKKAKADGKNRVALGA